LGLFYLEHRMSYELNFFTTEHPEWMEVHGVIRLCASGIRAQLEILRDAPTFRRYQLCRDNEHEILDFVLSVENQLDPIKESFGSVRVDTVREILTNKITTLISRCEVKDLIDLYFLEKQGFRIEEHMNAAKLKDGGLDPGIISKILRRIRIDEAPVYLIKPLDLEALRAYVEQLRLRMAEMALPPCAMITVITPNFNGERFLERCLRSVIAQRESGVELEYIFVDGGSTDGSMAIVEKFRADIDVVISEKDDGPASAINKGLRMAKGDLVAWLNADDVYFPGTLARVNAAFAAQPGKALGFGGCLIVDEQDREIRRGITKFKELFFPVSSRFTIQCINYISQPAMFFRRDAMLAAGFLREDLKAAWDYEFILRLWRQGGGFRVSGPPLSAFRWHEGSISGRHFRRQFQEELAAACADAGHFTPQALIHLGVCWGIIGCYAAMSLMRRS